MTNNIFDINGVSLSISRYAFNFDYDTERDCDRHGCDSICRCGRIINARIDEDTKIDNCIVSIQKKTNKKIRYRSYDYNPTDIERYCIDRLLHLHGLTDLDTYDVEIGGGYYGEEIVGVDHPAFGAFFKDVAEMINYPNDVDKVKLVIKAEYEFLLPELYDCSSAVVVDKIVGDIINNGSTNDRLQYMKKFDHTKYCITDGLPIGILLDNRLIDGHHRITVAAKAGTISAKFIELS
jgi:hypothetical protein